MQPPHILGQDTPSVFQTMHTLTLYSHRLSRGRAPLWLLEELAVDYQVVWLDFGEAIKSPAFIALNPMGKIPVLTHGQAVVTETAAILCYLADAFAERGWIPATGSAARAAFYRWLFFVAGPLEAATTAAFFNWQTPTTTVKGTSGSGFCGFGSLALTLHTLRTQLQSQPYLCGDTPTAADIYLASHLQMDISYTQTVAPDPVFADYLQRLLSRPAKLRADAR